MEENEEENRNTECPGSMYLIIKEIPLSKVKGTDKKLKEMGVVYNIHQFIHSNAQQALYIKIDQTKIPIIKKHMSDYLGWGKVSMGHLPQLETEEGEEEGATLKNPTLTLRLPKDHKKAVEKVDIIQAAAKKNILINNKDFNFTFFSTTTYQFSMRDQSKANDLRLQCNFILHGVDVHIQPWRQFLNNQLYSVVMSNYNTRIKRSDLARVVEEYASAPLMSVSHLKTNNTLGKPVSIFGFCLPEQQQ